jgi:hypothetical protein
MVMMMAITPSENASSRAGPMIRSVMVALSNRGRQRMRVGYRRITRLQERHQTIFATAADPGACTF